MSTSSIKRQIRRFHVVVLQWTSKKSTKVLSVMHVRSCLLFFWSRHCGRRRSCLRALIKAPYTYHRRRGVENKATELMNERKRFVIIVVWSEKGFSIMHRKTFRFLPENKSKKAQNTIKSRVFVFLNIAFVLVVDSAERDCGTKSQTHHFLCF